MLAYDPATNGAEWIPVWGSASSLSPVEEASARELNNIIPHDPAEVTQRMDHFGEQRGEGGMEEHAAETLHKEELVEEAMDLGYQPGSNGEEDSDSMDSPHSPGHALHHSSSRHHCQGSVSWMDQFLSKGEDQHLPEGAKDASHEATEESEGEEQSIPLASLQDEHEPMEGSAVLGQESLDMTSTRGNPPSDSQEEVIVHTAEKEIYSLC